MAFEPFSLAKSIGAGQQLRENRLRLGALEAEGKRQTNLRQIAQSSTKPFEQDLFPGEAPIPGLGTNEYDQQIHVEKLQAAGELEEAQNLQKQMAAMESHVAKMSKEDREAATYKAEEMAQALFQTKDNPELWAQTMDSLADKDMITPEQIVPYSPEAWQKYMDDATKVKDLLSGKDKSSGRGGYVTLQDVVIDNVTYKVPFDHRSGSYKWDEKLPSSKEGLMLSPKTPSQKKAVAKAKKEGTIEAEAQTTAKIDLPKVKSNAAHLKSVVRSALDHAGFKSVVGMPSFGKGFQFLGGTPEAGFRTIHKQITGKTFLQVYETLKGGGQITEVEGEKATAALQRLDTALREKEYIKAAEEFISEIDRLTLIAEDKSKGITEDSAKGIKSPDEDTAKNIKDLSDAEYKARLKKALE